ncbi:hypothetical protein NQ317_019170 [Molorchus minor]|uniref:MULE transposase domain-containing protein n=1 Tax=Molorchus minor TaxID=1323400 RepID=A0ABQ9JRV3_9CUCU|nr:hypothetical protein NQ317_019170 [Molorchus minor]
MQDSLVQEWPELKSEDYMLAIMTDAQSRVGTINVDVFMSDMAEQFANAWLEVMNSPKLRLYCTWHVDQAWRKNLHKIKTKEKQVTVYKQLRTVLQETDVLAFDKMLEALYVSLYEDKDTNDFAEYFKIYYMKNPTLWAYCHKNWCRNKHKYVPRNNAPNFKTNIFQG